MGALDEVLGEKLVVELKSTLHDSLTAAMQAALKQNMEVQTRQAVAQERFASAWERVAAELERIANK